MRPRKRDKQESTASANLVEMGRLYWFLAYKPGTKPRENVYMMAVVSRKLRQIIEHAVGRDKTSGTIQRIVSPRLGSPFLARALDMPRILW